MVEVHAEDLCKGKLRFYSSNVGFGHHFIFRVVLELMVSCTESENNYFLLQKEQIMTLCTANCLHC
jgi:hypothetical protein